MVVRGAGTKEQPTRRGLGGSRVAGGVREEEVKKQRVRMARKAVWPLPLLRLTQVGVAATAVWSDSILFCLEQCKGQEEAS